VAVKLPIVLFCIPQKNTQIKIKLKNDSVILDIKYRLSLKNN